MVLGMPHLHKEEFLVLLVGAAVGVQSYVLWDRQAWVCVCIYVCQGWWSRKQ